MRFSQKIFIISFVLMMTAMYISGFIIIKNNHEMNIDKEREISVNETNKIIRIVEDYSMNWNNVIYKNKIDMAYPYLQDETSIEEIINSFINITKYAISIEIHQNGSVLYSNIINDIPVIENAPEKINTYIDKVNDKILLFCVTSMTIKQDNYEIYTVRDITSLYQMRQQQITKFAYNSTILALASTFILAISIYTMTRRIDQLEKKVKKVSDGDYNITFQTKGKDEITQLNKGFEVMLQSIQKNIDKIEMISENRQTFIHDLTHEIRSPLTSIIGFSEMLINVKITQQETIQRYAQKIYEEGKYIENLTDGLTQIILLESGNTKIELENLTEIVIETVQMARDILNNPNLRLEIELEENVWKKINKSLMQSLIINLIKNANQAYEKEGTIKILLEKQKMQVIDYGKGIPKQEIEKIQEPFYTLNKSRNRKQQGMGLGIPLCLRIAEVHGFKMEIQSQINKGTIVTIYLL